MNPKFIDKAVLKGDRMLAPIVLTPKDICPKLRGFVNVRIWEGKVGAKLNNEISLGENLVVNSARRIMSRMLSGAAQWDNAGTPTDSTVALTNNAHPSFPEAVITHPAELFITKMRWGTGGHDIGNPTVAIPPDPDDENLTSTIVVPAFKTVTVDYPTTSSVRFSATLEQSEANGIGLSEVGLFTDQHTLLFSRKTFGILTKSSDFSFEFRYTILF